MVPCDLFNHLTGNAFSVHVRSFSLSFITSSTTFLSYPAWLFSFCLYISSSWSFISFIFLPPHAYLHYVWWYNNNDLNNNNDNVVRGRINAQLCVIRSALLALICKKRLDCRRKHRLHIDRNNHIERRKKQRQIIVVE